MVNGIRPNDPRELNKGRGSKHRKKVRGHIAWNPVNIYYNKDEDNSPKTMNDKSIE